MPETHSITLRAESTNLPRLIAIVTAAAAEAGLDEEGIFHCHLAVDEAATNIIDHAYKGRDPGDISLACTIRPDALEITLSDSGIPFDMDARQEAIISKAPEGLQVGGLGLTIIHRVMDEVSLTRNGECNTLTLVKRKKAVAVRVPGETITATVPEKGIVVITPMGRLSQDAVSGFAAALGEALGMTPPAIIIDLGRITYISSRGLSLIINAWKRQHSGGRHLILCCQEEKIRGVIEMIGFDQVIPIKGTPGEAFTFCESVRGKGGGEDS